MPVSKKPHTKSSGRRHSLTSAKRVAAAAHRQVKQKLAGPPIPTTYVPSTAQPLSLPGVQPKPRPLPVLIKTTYNTSRLKFVAVAGAVVVLLLLISLAWWQRDAIFQAIPLNRSPQSVYHLSAQAEKLDQAKAQTIMNQVRPQSSQGASPTPTAQPDTTDAFSLPSAEALTAYPSEQLLEILNKQIHQLQSEGQDVRLLELLKSSGSRSDLLKAIQLGREYQALYLYYKK